MAHAMLQLCNDVKQKEGALAELEAASTSLAQQIEAAKQGKEDSVSSRGCPAVLALSLRSCLPLWGHATSN